MNEDMATKSNKIIENLIGILLIMPIYMLFFVLLHWLNFNGEILFINGKILFLILMYLPVIIGMFLSYRLYQNKVSKLISICIVTFLILAVYFFYNTYFVEHSGFNGIGYAFLWLINTGITKVLTCVFYGKIVGWKKAIIFFTIYILLVISSFVLGFWA